MNDLIVVDQLPIEIQFEIFEYLNILDVMRGFTALNKKYCAMVGRYLLMNDYMIGRYFHQLAVSNSFSYISKLNEKKQIESELFNDGSNFPYLIRIASGEYQAIGELDGLKCLEKFGPNLMGIMMKYLMESIEDDSRFEDGGRALSLNLWNIDFSHLKSETMKKSLSSLEKLNHLVRLYLNCGPATVDYTQSDSPCLNVLAFMNSNLKNSFSSLRELYLTGYIGSSPHEINSIVNNLENLEKIHISFSVEFNKNTTQINPLEAPKSLREKLSHISLINVPARATRLFSVIDIFETFENLKYFEYHEVEGTGGVNINIKFDDYDKVIEKFSKTKLETLIYRPSEAHQRQIAISAQRQELIEELLENINNSDFPILFPNMKNIEVSEYEMDRECKYDALTAVIYYILPKIQSGGLLERIHAPSDCLEIATMLNCNNTTIELQLGSSPPELSNLIVTTGYRPKRKNRFGVPKEIFSQSFDKLRILTFENLGSMDSHILLLIGRNCKSLNYLRMTNCDFLNVENPNMKQELFHSLVIKTIAIQNCNNVPVCNLVNLMICSCDTLEYVIMKGSSIASNSLNVSMNGGVPVEMRKLHTLLFPKSVNIQDIYIDMMNYISRSCRLSSLHHLDVYGTVDDSVVRLFENNSAIVSLSLNVAEIIDPSVLDIINERGIKLKELEIEKNVNLDILLGLSSRCTCYLTSLKLLGSKIENNSQYCSFEYGTSSIHNKLIEGTYG
ncbi:predicted protein [Naegleria gruberi]|uniref:Predicted protein n=1 Tax=Naegleria gruberi TaxID=5762 RepID=D2VQK9_NAEGR|nr:uncharacterized protein NAEGRDRAFT_71262 [Naegleria gruberi]EFC40967.1 predicted protein [Naegleria gruberi]|eukprot:XP_002673711.1 predicted protein [Naegleria gruberi strain NEG-M]